jgi:hypothetical protein
VGNPAPGANRIVGGKEVDPPNAVPYQAFIQVGRELYWVIHGIFFCFELDYQKMIFI